MQDKKIIKNWPFIFHILKLIQFIHDLRIIFFNRTEGGGVDVFFRRRKKMMLVVPLPHIS